MYYVGLDIHKRYCMTTVMNKQGKVIDKARVESRPQDLRDYFEKMEEPTSVVMEACYNWGYFVDILDGIVDKVTLAHPLKTRAIADARIKTDSIDSKTLADLLRADLIPAAYIPDKGTRLMKNYLRYRAGLVAMSTAVKCKIHALLDQHDYAERETLAQFSDMFGKKGLELMAGVKLPGCDTQILHSWLELLAHIKKEILEANRWVREHVREDELALLLKTIPGIGDQFALLIRYEIDRIERFRNPNKLISYAGLAPSTYQSGNKVRHGKITKQGNKWLRWAFVEAVHAATISSPYLRHYFSRLQAKIGRDRACVATARKLAGIVFGVMKNRTPYRESLVGQSPSKGSSRSAA